MSGCTFPTLTQADVAALAGLEGAPSSLAELCKHAVLGARYERWLVHTDLTTCRPRLLTGPGGKRVPNRARHVPPVLRASLNAFQHDHCPDVIRVRALALMHVCIWRAARIGLCVRAGIRPRRVTAGGLVIVRGRR